MSGSDITSTIEDKQPVSERSPVSILMVAHAPDDALTIDRCRLTENFTVGRNAENDLIIEDGKISGSHLKIFFEDERFCIEDQGSTNGTYIEGKRLTKKKILHNNRLYHGFVYSI